MSMFSVKNREIIGVLNCLHFYFGENKTFKISIFSKDYLDLGNCTASQNMDLVFQLTIHHPD